ncbi:FecR family protein [Pseudomonas sp. Gutcm_11s]|uniref:FecR family protein n=1 Tax=Pseudomonas sp. Gutcm_11s TaxID=3026088 RepID=UPI002360EF1C|nr:FecR domain-containing protein [Pseudomonas sp. Gutcm_11s]MDD0844690.1 FecR domain-containing protein [Pseudomonas sp. Gutcm_11s]
MTAPSQPSAANTESLSQALDWLIRLDDADAATRNEFETWLSASEDNARAYRQASQMWGSPLLDVAASGLQQVNQQRQLRRRRVTRRAASSAAALLLCIAAVLQSDLPERMQADHITAVGQRQHLQLADGSRVLLNTDTALASRMDDYHRSTRLLYGEAYFDVAHDHSRPFEVDAGPVQVSVRGTAFAVRYLDDEAEVSVERGEVALRTPRNDASVSLGAGDSIRVGPDGFGPRRHNTQSQPQLAWVQGRLMFENCPLREVLAELRRYYPGWIVSTDERLADLNVTGNYRLDDPVGAMRSLAQVTSAQLHELPRVLILD